MLEDQKTSPFTKIPVRNIKKEGKYLKDDLYYMKSLSSAVLEKSTVGSRLVLWSIALSIAWLIFWANQAQIDEIARGEGKVIPSNRVQVVQNLEGGIVEEIFVREGENVKKGQPLLKIQDKRFVSSYEENSLKIEGLEAQAVRLYAEANGVLFGSGVDPKLLKSSFIDEEKSLYESNKIQLINAIGIIKNQLRQRQSELIEAQAKENQYKRSLELLKEEMRIKEPLVKQGVVPEVEYLQLKRQLNDTEGNLESVTLSIPRIESTIEEAKGKIQETTLSFRNKAKAQWNEVYTELQQIRQSVNALGDRVERTVVRSPVSGNIKQLFANTVGGVIKPGMDIVEIVPMEDVLLVEAQVKPSDIAFLHVGQKAIIKFTAYDFAIYGGLDGVVSQISSDTITDEKGNTFYLVKIKTDKTYLGSVSAPLNIKVGMITSVDILTGKKTVLDYLLKPILKAKYNALRER